LAFYDEPIKKYPIITDKREYQVKIKPHHNWDGLTAIVYKVNHGFHFHKFRDVSIFNETVVNMHSDDFLSKYKYNLVQLAKDAVNDYEEWETQENQDIAKLEQSVNEFETWNGKV
jgi:hypothetical protein